MLTEVPPEHQRSRLTATVPGQRRQHVNLPDRTDHRELLHPDVGGSRAQVTGQPTRCGPAARSADPPTRVPVTCEFRDDRTHPFQVR